jgi:hypothetical protein
MAESSSGNPVTHKVWTFVVRGGESFLIQLPRTPRLDHGGGMTMWKMVGTKAVADAVKLLILEAGGTIEVHTEGESAEQTATRQARVGIGDADADL